MSKYKYRLLCVLFVLLEINLSVGKSRTRASSSRHHSHPTSRPFPRPSPTHRPTHRPFPTHKPTHAPTFRPFPTHAPTSRPFPTHRPTSRPTHAPTFRPFPTPAPTSRPFPTHRPTSKPTHAPTFRPFPTPAPTSRPFPTHRPTSKPTHAPTFRPLPTPAVTSRPIPTHKPTYRPTHAPTFRPFPTPTPTPRPIPTFKPTFNPTQAPTFRPFPTPAFTSRPIPTHKPTFSPTQAPTFRPFPTPAPTSRPFPTPKFTSSPTHAPTFRPFPSPAPTARPFPIPQPTYRPSPTFKPTSKPYPPHSPPTNRPPHVTRFTSKRPLGPANPILRPGPHNQPVIYQPPVYYPAPGGKTKIKIKINNYHPSHYWAPPSYPVYHYTHKETGSGVLGFYLGHSLGRLTSPTYYNHRHTFYNGYSPVYDHYTIHHYYHNRETVPQNSVIQSDAIIACGGDVPSICPQGTVSLCTSRGQIMCVASALNTIPCRDNSSALCVDSTVPCVEGSEDPQCKSTSNQSVQVALPCISTAQVFGNLTVVNNTIVNQPNKTIATPPSNGAIVTTLPPLSSGPILTTLPPIIGIKQELPKQYCVTILAVPSKRKLTEGEEAINEMEKGFQNFFVKVFGLRDIKKKPSSRLGFEELLSVP